MESIYHLSGRTSRIFKFYIVKRNRLQPLLPSAQHLPEGLVILRFFSLRTGISAFCTDDAAAGTSFEAGAATDAEETGATVDGAASETDAAEEEAGTAAAGVPAAETGASETCFGAGCKTDSD